MEKQWINTVENVELETGNKVPEWEIQAGKYVYKNFTIEYKHHGINKEQTRELIEKRTKKYWERNRQLRIFD